MASDVQLPLIAGGVVATDGSAATQWIGGRGTLLAESSNWNSATAKLQYMTPAGTWLDVGTTASLTANGMVNFELPPGRLRVTVTGSPTALSVWAIGTRIV